MQPAAVVTPALASALRALKAPNTTIFVERVAKRTLRGWKDFLEVEICNASRTFGKRQFPEEKTEQMLEWVALVNANVPVPVLGGD